MIVIVGIICMFVSMFQVSLSYAIEKISSEHLNSPLSVKMEPYNNGVFILFTEKSNKSGLRLLKTDNNGKVVNVDVMHSIKYSITSTNIYSEEEGKDICIFYRLKKEEGEKYLYSQRSSDGGKTFERPIVINTDRDVIGAVEIEGNNRGALYVAWIDERRIRLSKENAGYDIYLNYSHDRCNSFLSKDLQMSEEFTTVTLLTITASDDKVMLPFIGLRMTDKKAGVFVKNSKDKGVSWDKAFFVSEIDGAYAPEIIKSLITSNGYYIVWGGSGGINLAHSKNGDTWKIYRIFKGTEIEKFTGQMDVIETDSYILVAAGIGKWDSQRDRPVINLIKIKKDGEDLTFQSQNLGNLKYRTTSQFMPRFAVSSDKKKVVAVWVDYRNIRGAVYMNYSKDGGITWQTEDIAISPNPGKFNEYLPFITYTNGVFHLIWQRFTTDNREELDLYYRSFREEDLK